MLRRAGTAGCLLAAACWAASAQAGATLDAVRARGQVVCGVGDDALLGLSAQAGDGRWEGLDVDICRAIAAAVLGDGEKVRYVPLSHTARFTALQAGEVDVLSRSTTITLARDASMGLHMTAVAFYDTQGFMVPARSRIRSARQLKDKTVCVLQATTTVRNLAEYSRNNRLELKTLAFDSLADVNAAYFAGRCDAYSGDMSQLASLRARLVASPDMHVLLPEIIAKEPLGPMVRRGDTEWTTIVRWVVYGLIEAEELGVTRANLEQLRASSQEPAVQRIVGTGEDLGRLLGLERDWLARAIRATGNYGEIFERNLGRGTPLALPRGLNSLWNKGGLHFAPPLR
ncbi:amino acid ABC transporter substrate-binding protein [Pseudorhodoferax sp. Leaf274]|nr:amino acid ABC transporter substrate-binding protein [Pseudorhodoferax sp. Leaf274]